MRRFAHYMLHIYLLNYTFLYFTLFRKRPRLSTGSFRITLEMVVNITLFQKLTNFTASQAFGCVTQYTAYCF